MNKLITLTYLLLFSSVLLAQQIFTLEQAIDYGLENSSQARLNQLELEDAEGQILEYKAIGIPKINGAINYQHSPNIATFILPDFITPAINRSLLSYGLIDPSQVIPPAPGGNPAQFGTSNNLTAGLELSALLFDGSFFVGLRAQRLYRELIQKQAELPKLEIKSNIQKAFLSVLIAKRNEGLLQKNISNLQNTLRETKAIYENGFAEKLDVDRLELSLNNLNVEAGKVQRLIELSYNLLKFQMSYPLNEPIEIEGDLDMLLAQINIESVAGEELDFSRRPELAVIESGQELAEMNVKRLKAAYLPSLVGFANYSQQLQRNDLFDKNENPWFTVSNIGASLQVPIFDGLDKKAKMQRARIELDKTAIQKRDFERGVTLEVQNAKIAFLNANQTVETTRKSLDLAQQIYDITQIKYKEGVGSSIEVAQAERELYTAQSANMNALFDLLVAKTDLDKALGKL